MPSDTDADRESLISEILEALSEEPETSITREELEKEVRKFLEYGVPLEQAKQTLIKKYKKETPQKPVLTKSERTLLVDMQPNQQTVHILCRVISVNPKEVTARGEKRQIFYGIFGDESGTASFTAWKDFQLEKGQVIEIKNAYTREWQGAAQINLGDRTTVEKADESRLSEAPYEPREYKLKDLRQGLGVVEVTGKILEVSSREVEVSGQKKTVYSGMIGDETGKAQFTAWHDFKLKNGDVVKIRGGYIKTWKGVPQLSFDEKSTVQKLGAETISKKDIKTQKISLHELVEKKGALDVEVEGTVLEIREGSGVVKRCPECRRVLVDEKCQMHGSVKGELDLRVKIVLDDGTGTVTSSLNREITEQLLQKPFSEWKTLAEQAQDSSAMMKELYSLLFARRLNIQGNALGDQFGTAVIAKSARFADIDLKKESENVLHELEGLL